MSKMRLLKRVKVHMPGPSLSDAGMPLEYVTGEKGVEHMLELADLRVEVYGKNKSFCFWPSNIVWVEYSGELLEVVERAGALDSQEAIAPGDVSAPSVAVNESAPLPPTLHPSSGLAALAPSDQPTEEPAPEIPSVVAQPAEHVAVNDGDESSNPSDGAKTSLRKNSKPRKRAKK